MLNNKKDKNGKCSIKLDGELDIYAAASFHKEFMPCLNDCESMVVDLSEVSEMDTSCFQVLIQAKRECEE
ncbi:MAG: STAS domain-containing protein, partial [Gammaproteobacteria bacterium]|nr:STAS domain-containing protein [Gammaproteobacteria bacterium]